MAKKTPDPAEPMAVPNEPAPMLKATVEPVPDAAPATIKLSIHNISDEPITLNKTSACWRGRLGNDVFAIFPECNSEILEERVEYIGPYVNYSNEKGENEFVLSPGESMERELSLEASYDFAFWRERGCSRFRLRYRALHRLPGRRLQTIESAPVLIEL